MKRNKLTRRQGLSNASIPNGTLFPCQLVTCRLFSYPVLKRSYSTARYASIKSKENLQKTCPTPQQYPDRTLTVSEPYLLRTFSGQKYLWTEKPRTWYGASASRVQLTHRNYFNVYAVFAESKEEGVGEKDAWKETKNKFGTAFGTGTEIVCNDDLVFEYARKVKGLSADKQLIRKLCRNQESRTWRNGKSWDIRWTWTLWMILLPFCGKTL